jgi:bacillopeptidase F
LALTHASPLVPGQRYTLTVRGTDGLARSVSGVQAFRASTDEQDSSSAAGYRWKAAASAHAYGRSYQVESGKGATASVAFRGSAITWYTMTGPAEGRASVYVDGVKKAAVNNWSAATKWHVPRTVSGLKPGAHRLQIVVAGAKGSTKGTGTDIVLDAVKVAKKLLATPAAVTTWRRVKTSAASGGGYTASTQRGATASLVFRGTSLAWVSARGPAMGKAKVYVDGVLKTTVDGYAKRSAWNIRRTVTGLSDTLHTVKIVVTGKRRASTGTTVVVDRWLVG